MSANARQIARMRVGVQRAYPRAMKRNGNPAARSGVCTGMYRALLVLSCVGTALSQAPQLDPIFAKRDDFWKARREGRFADAAALREEARTALQQLPADAAPFSSWVQTVAEMYVSGARTAQARALVEEALARTGKSGTSNPNRMALLSSLAQVWQQDGNLLNAVLYQEQAVAEAEKLAASPAARSAPAGTVWAAVSGRITRFGFSTDLGGAYHQLADFYRQLGRREAVETVVDRVRQLAAKQDDGRYAWFFQRYGHDQEALAMFRQQVASAANPQQAVSAWQQLADFYSAQGQYDQAISATQQAIAAARASGANDIWPRQTLISILQQAGRTGQIDEVYQGMLATAGNAQDGNQFQVLLNYANYLAGAKRGAEAETLLADYRKDHPDLPEGQDWSLLNALSYAAGSSGDEKRAKAYREQAAAKQAGPKVAPIGSEIAPDFQKAQAMAQEGKTGEALALALQAIGKAPNAPDREQVAWLAPSLAGILEQKKATGAVPIYGRLFAVLEDWAADTQQPLLSATENYLHLLISQRERWAEVPVALDHFRGLLIAAHGADSAPQKNALQMTIEFAYARNAPETALQTAMETARLEESLSGTASEAYLGELRTIAECQLRAGQPEASADTYLKRVAIADAGYAAGEMIRGYTRTDAAQALARQGQFDEAERLAAEAVELSKNWPHQSSFFVQQQETIRKMRLARASR